MTKDKVAIVAGCTMITLLLFGYSAYLFSDASRIEESKQDNLEEKEIVKQETNVGELSTPDTFQLDIQEVRARYNKAFGKKGSDSTVKEIVVLKPLPEPQKKVEQLQKTTASITSKKEIVEPKKTIRTRSGLGSTLVYDTKTNSTNNHKKDYTSLQIAAEIPVKVNFQEGTTIPIRTLGTCSIDGKQYPSGTKLIAVGKIAQNRILLNVESLILDNGTQNVALKVYATDGILGLPYDSGDDRFSEAGSTAMGQVIRQINLPVIGMVSIPRKQKKTILEMPAGYPIYLKP